MSLRFSAGGARKGAFALGVISVFSLGLDSSSSFVHVATAMADSTSPSTGATGSGSSGLAGSLISQSAPLPSLPTLNQSAGAGLGTDFQGCNQPLQNIASSLSTALNSVGKGKSLPSPSGTPTGSCSAPELGDIGCDASFAKSSEAEARETDLLKTSQTACQDELKKFTDEQKQLEDIRQELHCLQQQGTTLGAQIAALGTEYNTKLQQARQAVSMMSDMYADRENQIGLATQILTGQSARDPGVKKTGLNDEITQVQAKVWAFDNPNTNSAQGPLGIPGIQAQQALLVQKQAEFQVQVKMATAAQMNQCFIQNTALNPSWTCSQFGSANSTPVSAQDYSICLLRSEVQNTQGDPNGAQATNNAQSAVNQLQAILGAIQANTPKSLSPPVITDPNSSEATQEAIAYMSQASGVMTYNDISTQYGSALMALNQYNPSRPVGTLILDAYAACYQQAQTTIAAQENQAGTPLQRTNDQNTQFQKSIVNSVNILMTEYSSQLNDIHVVLTGMAQPPQISGCMNAQDATVQLNCLTTARNNLNNLLEGGPNSQVTINLATNFPGNEAYVNCNGLKGCATMLNNSVTQLRRIQTQLETTKTNYINQTNAAIDQFTATMAKNFAPAKNSLSTQLAQINLQLSKLHVSGVHITPVTAPTPPMPTGTPTPPDTVALYGNPPDVLALIGGSPPPMINIANEDFSDSVSGITQKEGDIEKDRKGTSKASSEIQSDLVAVSGLYTKCREKGLKQKAEDVREEFQTLRDNCMEKGPEILDLANLCAPTGHTLGTDANNINSILRIDAGDLKTQGLTSLGDIQTALTQGLSSDICRGVNFADPKKQPDSNNLSPYKGTVLDHCTSAVSDLTNKAKALKESLKNPTNSDDAK